jgi:hypothetical protein
MTQNTRKIMNFRANIRGNNAQTNALSNTTDQTGRNAIQKALRLGFQDSKNANIGNANAGQNYRGQNTQNVGGSKNAAGQDLNEINIKINTAKAATRKFDDNKKTNVGGSILGAIQQ